MLTRNRFLTLTLCALTIPASACILTVEDDGAGGSGGGSTSSTTTTATTATSLVHDPAWAWRLACSSSFRARPRSPSRRATSGSTRLTRCAKLIVLTVASFRSASRPASAQARSFARPWALAPSRAVQAERAANWCMMGWCQTESAAST